MKKNIFIILLLLSMLSQSEPSNQSNSLNEMIQARMAADDTSKTFSRLTLEKESEQKEKFMCVSLGSNCYPALHLQKNNLHRWSFPFDWNITSLYGLRKLIKHNFKDFLNPSYLSIMDIPPAVYNAQYAIALPHDFPEGAHSNGVHYIVGNYREYIADISDKYARRIKRFFDVCNLAEMVYFFRVKAHWWTFDAEPHDKQGAIKLRDLLYKTFPTKNWVLVFVDSSSEFAHDWHIPHIKNFCIDNIDSTSGWVEIYQKLGLLN